MAEEQQKGFRLDYTAIIILVLTVSLSSIGFLYTRYQDIADRVMVLENTVEDKEVVRDLVKRVTILEQSIEKKERIEKMDDRLIRIEQRQKDRT